MKIKTWGCRGSIAINNPDSKLYGGNTTCFEIISECLPIGTKLMIDAGTGFVPAGRQYLQENVKDLNYVIMFTHYHWDHVLGLTLAPPTFIDHIPMALYGPRDGESGLNEMMDHVFQRPYFPVDAKKIRHKIKFTTFSNFDVEVVVVHPEGGFTELNLDEYRLILTGNQQLLIREKNYNINECLVMTMTKTNHGNSTCISYRVEERSTSKVFVLLTDHEDTAGISIDIKKHLKDVDLAIIDGQYDEFKYQTQTANFGHGTPGGLIQLAVASNITKVGITHHDPTSTDVYLENVILKEAHEAFDKWSGMQNFLDVHKISELRLKKENIFLCKDYDVYEL
ncbi:MBL fold metallo-hydrolase [bacterium]|nr:MBL fold metallo-hydrolase [bacterium]